MSLLEALDIRKGKGEVIAFVGAGGKTTAALRLAGEWGRGAIFTTTTRILEPIPAQDEYLLLSESQEAILENVPHLLGRYPRIILAGRRLTEIDPHEDEAYPFPVRSNKLKGISPAVVDRLAARLPETLILVEADGARHRSLKAPAPYEPVVPASTTILVPMAALDVLGQPLTEERVHRVQQVAALSGTAPGQIVTPRVVAAVLGHPQGGLKDIPPGARAIPILNQLAGEVASPGAREVAHLLLQNERIGRVVIASLRAPRPALEIARPRVAAIVLAAGASQRMGRPKQLLPVGDKTMLKHLVDVVRASSASPIIVVLGHRASEMKATLQEGDVEIVVNEDWEAGLSTSVQAGLRAVAPEVQAALFVLADQPALTAEVIAQIVEHYRRTRGLIVVPTYGGRRGNPVLFDRALFPALMQVEGDQGGRSLLSRYPSKVEEVAVSSAGVLVDIDTPDDYQRLMNNRGSR